MVYGILATVIAIGKIISSSLLLVPSCMKNHQAASKWRLLLFPFILVTWFHTVYLIPYYIYEIGVQTSFISISAIGLSLGSLCNEMAMNVACIACTLVLMKSLEPQSSMSCTERKPTKKGLKTGPHGLGLSQKFSVAAVVFVLTRQVPQLMRFLPWVSSVFSLSSYQVSELTRGYGVMAVIIAIGKMLSSVLVLVPTCIKSSESSNRYRLLSRWMALIFMLVQGGDIIFTIVSYSHLNFPYLTFNDVSYMYWYTNNDVGYVLYHFTLSIAINIALIALIGYTLLYQKSFTGRRIERL